MIKVMNQSFYNFLPVNFQFNVIEQSIAEMWSFACWRLHFLAHHNHEALGKIVGDSMSASQQWHHSWRLICCNLSNKHPTYTHILLTHTIVSPVCFSATLVNYAPQMMYSESLSAHSVIRSLWAIGSWWSTCGHGCCQLILINCKQKYTGKPK